MASGVASPVWSRAYHDLTPARWAALEALAGQGERGSTSMPQGPLNGGVMAALVQLGFADRLPPDRLGGNRYRANVHGAAALERRAGEQAPKVKPRGSSATMAHRDAAADGTDFFPTPPVGGRAGAEVILKLDPVAHHGVWWEPACGAGHLLHGLADYAPRLYGSDLHAYAGNPLHDFVGSAPAPVEADWIVSNPPFDLDVEFIVRGLQLARRGVAMLLRLNFLESIGRHPLLHGERPLTVVAPFAERLPMVKGRWDPDKTTAMAYAWFIWLQPSVQSTAARVAREARQVLGAALEMPIPPGTIDRLTRDSDLAFAVGGPG